MKQELNPEHSQGHNENNHESSLSWRDRIRRYGAIPAAALAIFAGGEAADNPIKGRGMQTEKADSMWDALENTEGIESVDRSQAVRYVQDTLGEEGTKQANQTGLYPIPEKIESIDSLGIQLEDGEWILESGEE